MCCQPHPPPDNTPRAHQQAPHTPTASKPCTHHITRISFVALPRGSQSMSLPCSHTMRGWTGPYLAGCRPGVAWPASMFSGLSTPVCEVAHVSLLPYSLEGRDTGPRSTPPPSRLDFPRCRPKQRLGPQCCRHCWGLPPGPGEERAPMTSAACRQSMSCRSTQ